MPCPRLRCGPILALLGVFAFLPVPRAAAVDPTWAGLWREDLETVRKEVPRVHANAFHTISRERWNAAIDSLERRLPGLHQYEVTVALARIVAAIGDGHTRLTLPVDPGFGAAITHTPTAEVKDPALRLHYLPIRLYLYDDGLFVREIDAAHAAFAGARVVRIGAKSEMEARAAVSPTIQRDNDQQVASRLPVHLMIPELLHAVGVTEDPARAEFEFELPGGNRAVMTLDAVPFGSSVSWVSARAAGEEALYRRHSDANFWSADLAAESAVYIRMNQIQDGEDESMADFADRVFDAFGAGPARRMVLDLRGNPGGNNSLNRRFLHRAICSPKLREPAAFFVVVDRGTFSAAMMLVTALEAHTSAFFVGEATGASPNGYGDSRKIVLPNTGLTVRASTLYWQMSDPRDERPFTEPDVAVALTSTAAAANRDPVLETLADVWSRPEEPDGRWTGTACVGFQRFPIALELDRSRKAWRGSYTAPDLEVDHAPLGRVRVDGRLLYFDLPSPAGVFPVRAWLGAGRLLGEGESGGSSLRVSLRRAP